MDSGSRSGGQPEHVPGHGRHRAGSGAFDAGWTPAVVPSTLRPPGHRRPAVGPPGPPPRDPLFDTGPHGLRAFDLGTIPASVTPPRTWRRAAWFAVFASAAALTGLLVVTAALVGPVRTTSRIDALPNFPRGLPLLTVPGPTSTAVDGARFAARRGTTSATGAGGQSAASPDAPGSAPLPGPSGSTGTTGSGGPTGAGGVTAHPTGASGPTGPTVSAPPTVTAVSTGPPTVDAGKLANTTRVFFSEVTTNVQAAANLAANTTREDAAAVIQQRYGDISTIQVQQISVDPSSGVTVNVLRLVHKDGTTTTDRTTLQFTLTDDPKIVNPGG